MASAEQSKLQQAIAADAELLRVLTSRPEILRQILLNACESERLEAAKAAYLSECSDGFYEMLLFLARMETPLDHAGEPLLIDGKMQCPMMDANGASLLDRFFKWHRIAYFWPSIRVTIQKYRETYPDEIAHANNAERAVALIGREIDAYTHEELAQVKGQPAVSVPSPVHGPFLM